MLAVAFRAVIVGGGEARVRLSGSAVATTMFTGFLQPWVGGIVFSLGV